MSMQPLNVLAQKLSAIKHFLNHFILKKSGFWKYLKETTKSPASDMVWIQADEYTFQLTKGDKYWKNGKDFVSIQYGRRHSGLGSDHLVNTAEVPENIDLMELAEKLPYRCHCNCDCDESDLENTAIFQIKMANLFWSKICALYDTYLNKESTKEDNNYAQKS